MTIEEDQMLKLFKEGMANQPLKFMPQPKEITIEQLFPTGNYLNIRVGMKWSVADEDPRKVMDMALEMANQFHRQHFPKLYDKEGKPLFSNYTGEEAEQVIKQDKKTTGFAHFEEKINECTTIPKPDGIEQWRTIADTNPKLKELFNKRLEQLKNNQL